MNIKNFRLAIHQANYFLAILENGIKMLAENPKVDYELEKTEPAIFFFKKFLEDPEDNFKDADWRDVHEHLQKFKSFKRFLAHHQEIFFAPELHDTLANLIAKVERICVLLRQRAEGIKDLIQ